MTSMKDYADKTMNDTAVNQENPEELENTFKEALAEGHCPYCKGSDFIIQPEKIENGFSLPHLCLECHGRWFLDINISSRSICFGPIESETEPE